MVQPFGDQLLARPSLANDEHCPIQRRGAARALDRVEKRKALPNELFRPLHVFPIKSGRLLVANPTIWQGFSTLAEVENRENSERLGFLGDWHVYCLM